MPRPIATSLHARSATLNRKRLSEMLAPDSLAIFTSNTEMIANADAHYAPYEANTTLLWLSAVSQPKTFLIIEKQKTITREWLFIDRPNPHAEIWNGYQLSKEDARTISGIRDVFYSDEMDSLLAQLAHRTQTIYLHTNENDRRSADYFFDSEHTFVKKIKKAYPLHNYLRSAPLVKTLRMQKNKFEIARIAAAIEVTKNTFLRLLPQVKTFTNEREIHAHIVSDFIRAGAREAFPSIVAAGDNARILHYTNNDQAFEKNGLVLIDFGARKDFYNADITRTIPVSGVFSDRQRVCYNACLHLYNYAKSLLKPKVLLGDYTKKMGAEATKIFKKIGLLSASDIKNEDPQNPAYRKYLYHGISHHLGLDVHDISETARTPIVEGMVLTVEPGIYIKQERMGIRIENDVLITKTGCRDLASAMPILADDIERFMQAKKPIK